MTSVPGAEILLARRLIIERRSAALATLGEGGAPFASFVITAAAEDAVPLLLLSRLAVHTRNIERDARASLLFTESADGGAPAATTARLTLVGRLLPDDRPQTRARFLAVNADAERYAAFADFAFYRFEIGSAHLVAGFGRIIQLTTAEILADNTKVAG